MITVSKADRRGKTTLDWLKSFHSFSFGEFIDPEQHDFSDLRVINDDFVRPDSGFGMHPHRDMEIFTYVLSGELEHKDSMGNGSVIRAGDVQAMSAGSGVFHSEFNPSKTEWVHLLQIWLFPNKKSVAPRYQQTNFKDSEKRGKLRLILSPDGENGSLGLYQDARIYAGLLDGNEKFTHVIPAGRKAYVHVVRGELDISGKKVKEGDSVRAGDEKELVFTQGGNAEVLVFDLR